MGLIKKRKRVVGGTAKLRDAAPAAEVAAGEANVDSGDESSIASGKEEAPSTEDEEFETPDEKRVRLAKELLGKLGESKTPTEVQEQLDQDVALQAKRTRMHIEDVEIGEQRLLKGHKLAVTCVCLTSDDRTAFSGGKDCHVMRWDVETGVRDHFPGGRNKFNSGGHFSQVLSMALCEPRNLLLSVGVDRVVRQWDPRAPRHTHCKNTLSGHQLAVTGVVVDHDSTTAYTSSLDKSLKVWDIRKNRCLDKLYGHVTGINSLDLAAKSRPVTGGTDKSVRVWKIDQGKHILFNRHTYSVDTVTGIDQERMLSGSQDGELNLWNVTMKRPLASLNLGASCWFNELKAVRFSDVAFGSGQDGLLRCWRYAKESVDGERPQLKIRDAMTPLAVPGFINDIAIGKKIVVCAVGREHKLGRWNYSKDRKNGVLIVPWTRKEIEEGTTAAQP
jgi:ribosomal RNA-processing protein 9